jgi:hypothetical protein
MWRTRRKRIDRIDDNAASTAVGGTRFQSQQRIQRERGKTAAKAAHEVAPRAVRAGKKHRASNFTANNQPAKDLLTRNCWYLPADLT